MIGSTPSATEGSAIYAEALYSWKTLSVSATYRMLDNMGTNLTLYGSGTGNMMNYLPSLTRQYTYMLANLNPYQVNTVGEQAGQVDLFYSLRSPSARHRYWNFHVNWSGAYTLRPEQQGIPATSVHIRHIRCGCNVEIPQEHVPEGRAAVPALREQRG